LPDSVEYTLPVFLANCFFMVIFFKFFRDSDTPQ
jgi:hypothetical protein